MQALKARLTAVSPHLKEGPKYAVLFSGGVDCTLLALLADAILPPSHSIDLLNVAFENPRVIAAAAMQAKLDHAADTTDFGYASCPDRVTGLSSYSQLKALRPNRHWRFVSISVPYVEVERHRDAVINLMYPHKTEMDLSIALALYFAARGSGEVASADSNNSYTSPARVLLSGLGADELFGGYSRHEKAYKRNKYEGLLDELDLDFGRLASRNLGRDDRVVAHWGREIRYPYLDEVFVQWALRLPIWEKCGFGLHGSTCSEPQTKILEPAKILLRLLAWKLGLKRTACEKKRAIQFGTRTARMNQAKKKGTETI
ncbi:MAG: hypothetical protein LQ340_007063 [Diploschistes diacapsis]|nr:MAG: hypothetical protein LQ340_007063 [Diploschistes diacapsis]